MVFSNFFRVLSISCTVIKITINLVPFLKQHKGINKYEWILENVVAILTNIFQYFVKIQCIEIRD